MPRPAREAPARATAGGNYAARLVTPFAVVGIRTAGERLSEIVYLPRATPPLAPRNALAEKACRQIARYVDDPQFRFSLPLALEGTPFRRRVWDAIAAIPCGRTATYGDLARALASAPRAVGAACGDNPLPLVVPCHRVVAAGGLGGFMHASGGDPLRIKRWLLAHEDAHGG